jgi:hypothetical protein
MLPPLLQLGDTFDENINKGTGNITISGTGFTQTVNVTTNAVKVAGKKATIDLAKPFPLPRPFR